MLATAGMRMIPESDQNAILSELRANVPKVTNFIFSDNHVDIISGKEEGVYAWISANYVLNRLKVLLRNNYYIATITYQLFRNIFLDKS